MVYMVPWLTREIPAAADAVRKHKEQYQNDSRGDENSVGIAAAMQALKMFNQNQDTGKQSQGAFLGLAMSEASKVR